MRACDGVLGGRLSSARSKGGDHDVPIDNTSKMCSCDEIPGGFVPSARFARGIVRFSLAWTVSSDPSPVEAPCLYLLVVPRIPRIPLDSLSSYSSPVPHDVGPRSNHTIADNKGRNSYSSWKPLPRCRGLLGKKIILPWLGLELLTVIDSSLGRRYTGRLRYVRRLPLNRTRSTASERKAACSHSLRRLE